MPTPEGLDVTTLHGLYVEPDETGTPLQGTLSFTPNPSFVTFPVENLILAGTETATLDVNGEFTIDLVSTGQGTENPPDWLYTVTEKIIGQRPRTYNIALPYNSGATVELADITPTEVAPTYIPVVGPQGVPGVVSSVNGYTTSTIVLNAADVGALPTSARGAAGGVASLDGSTKVPVAQIPDLSATYVAMTLVGAASGVASLSSGGLIPSAQLDLASAAPPSVGTGAVGVSTKLARQDHTHDGLDLTSGQSAAGAKNFTTSVQTARFGVGVTPATHRGRVKSVADEVVLFLEQTASSPANPLLSLQSAASADKAYASSIPADTTPRLVITVAGGLSWGPGNAVADVSLSRTAVGILTTDGQIISTVAAPTAAGHLTRKDYVDNNFVGLTGAQTVSGVKTFSAAPISQAASAGTVVFNYRVTGDTVSRLTVGADGTLSWGPGGSTAVDTIMTRVASEGLQLNMAYKVARAATSNVAFGSLVTGDSFDRYRLYIDGLNEWGPGNATRDSNLYRSGANALKTDDSLIVAIDLSVLGNASVTGNLTQTGSSIRYRPQVTGTATITFASTTSNSTSVSFGQTFPSIPNVAITINSGAGSTIGWMCRALNVTTTGFDLNVATNGSAAAWSSIPVMWTATAV